MAITFDLTSNAVVNDGQTASFEVSNIQGVPVSGCPIGKTFYEGGTVAYPFTSSGWSGFDAFTVLTPESITTTMPNSNPTETYQYIWGSQEAIDSLKFSAFIGYSLNYSRQFRVSIDQPEFLFEYISSISVRTYRVYVNGVVELETTLPAWSSGDTSAISVDIDFLSGTGKLIINGVEHTYSFTPFSPVGSSVSVFSSGRELVTVLEDLNIVSPSGFPNNCTGEVPDATIEYYRNGVLDYTGNPWSFQADGSMDGDSIVAVVSSGVVLQYNFNNISPFVRDPAYADMTFSLVSDTEIMWEQLSTQYAQYNSDGKNWIDAPFFFEFDLASVGNIGSSSVSWLDISAYNSSGVKITEVLQIVHEVGVSEVSIRFAGGQFLNIPFAYSTFFVRADYDGSEMTLSIFESNGGTLIETRTVTGDFSGAVSVKQYVASVGCTTTVSNFATDMLVSDDTFEKSNPVTMSVLHYTSQPPSPQNLTEGDSFNATWDIAGVTGEAVSGCPIGNSKYYQGTNGYALSSTDFFGTPAGVITNQDGSATLSGSGNHRVLTPELWGDTTNGIKKIVEKFKWRSGVTNVTSGAGVFSNQDSNLSAGLYVNNGEVYLLGTGIDTGYQASLYDTDVYFTVTSTYNGTGGLSTILEIVSDKGYSDSISTSTTVSPTAEPSLSTVSGIASSPGTADAVFILSEKEGTAGYFPDACTGLSYQTDYTVNKNGTPIDSGSTTDTTISYSIPSVALGDAGNYDLTITNGGRDPFRSDIVVVNVASATSSHLPFAGYSVDISLGLSIQSGMRSNQVVYDYGLHADEYTSEIEYYSESESDFPTVAKNAPNDVKEEGFFPFAPHVTNSSLNGYRYPKFAGKYNFLGKYWKWDVEVIPYDVTEFEYAPQTWSCNSVTNFSFGNLANFIIPDISPISEFNVQYNRSGNVIREYERIKESSARKVKFKWTRLKNDEAAALLSYIITGVRSSQIPVDFGDMAISSPWVVRDGETGTIFNMRLSSNIIKVKHRSGNIWDVEIEMLKVEE